MKTLETVIMTNTTTAQSKSKRMNGKVRATFPDRGFFWITGEDGRKFFGHQTKVVGGFLILDMWEGQECTFEPEYDDGRGPRAVMIEMVEDRA